MAVARKLVRALENLLPETEIVETQRLFNVHFRGTKALHAFVDRLSSDDDVVALWHLALVWDVRDGRRRTCSVVRIPQNNLSMVVRVLTAATAAPKSSSGDLSSGE